MTVEMTARTLPEAGSLELRGDREIVVTWRLSAPPRLVYDAWTRPELVRRWWAPAALGMEMVDCQADLRVGGRYRYVVRGPQGELAFSGTYTELSPPSGLRYTHVFEPMAAAGELAVTVSFTERAGATELVVHERYPAAEVRSAALCAGADSGRRETMNQLEALLVSLR